MVAVGRLHHAQVTPCPCGPSSGSRPRRRRSCPGRASLRWSPRAPLTLRCEHTCWPAWFGATTPTNVMESPRFIVLSLPSHRDPRVATFDGDSVAAGGSPGGSGHRRTPRGTPCSAVGDDGEGVSGRSPFGRRGRPGLGPNEPAAAGRDCRSTVAPAGSAGLDVARRAHPHTVEPDRRRPVRARRGDRVRSAVRPRCSVDDLRVVVAGLVVELRIDVHDVVVEALARQRHG